MLTANGMKRKDGPVTSMGADAPRLGEALSGSPILHGTKPAPVQTPVLVNDALGSPATFWLAIQKRIKLLKPTFEAGKATKARLGAKRTGNGLWDYRPVMAPGPPAALAAPAAPAAPAAAV